MALCKPPCIKQGFNGYFCSKASVLPNFGSIFSITEEKGFSRYLKNTTWLFAEKGFRLAASLVVGVWVARYLGPERYGILNYALSFVGLFLTLATLGLDGIVIREIIDQPERKDRLVGTAFWMKLAGAIVVLAILFGAVQLSGNTFEERFLIFCIGASVLFQSFNVIDFEFQSKVLSKYVVKASLASLVVSAAGKVLLILLEAPLIYFGVVLLAEAVVLALGLIYYYLKHGQRLRFWQFDRELALSLFRDSWPLILSGIVITLYMKIDQIMIKEMLDNDAVGQYAAAVRLSEIWYFIPIVIANSLFPSIVNSKKIGEGLYYGRLQKLYSLMVLIAVAIAVPITMGGGWIVALLYGTAYDETAAVLKIHIWSAVFIFLLHASGKWLINENLTQNAFYRNLAGAVLNIALNFYLIPTMGIVGSAVATLISYATAGFLYDLFDKKLRKSFYLKLNAFWLKNLTN